MTAPSIMIATPTFGGVCHIGFVTSVLDSMLELDRRGIPAMLSFFENSGLIHLARNRLAAEFLAWDRGTHWPCDREGVRSGHLSGR